MTADELRKAGEAYRQARDRMETERLYLRGEIRDAAAAGMSESEMARVTGVQRETVRKALGKGLGSGSTAAREEES